MSLLATTSPTLSVRMLCKKDDTSRFAPTARVAKNGWTPTSQKNVVVYVLQRHNELSYRKILFTYSTKDPTNDASKRRVISRNILQTKNKNKLWHNLSYIILPINIFPL